MKHPKFTKSVKVGRSVYSPDELNRLYKHFRAYVKAAHRRGKPARFYYDHVSVSKSGMTHRLKFYTLEGGHLCRVNYDFAALTGYKVDKNDLIVMGGTGYNHADSFIQHVFHVLGLDVYMVIYPNGNRGRAYDLIGL